MHEPRTVTSGGQLFHKRARLTTEVREVPKMSRRATASKWLALAGRLRVIAASGMSISSVSEQIAQQSDAAAAAAGESIT